MLLFGKLAKMLHPVSKRTETTPDDYAVLADESDARAAVLHIDPPRPGRKTYTERYEETTAMSTPDIEATIAKRQAEGKECGVLLRVLAERGNEK